MRPIRLATALAAGLTLLLASAPVLAEQHEAAEATNGRKPWDQEAMTDLTGQLSESMRAVRRSFRQDPQFRTRGTANQRATQQMEQTLRNLETSTRQLRNRVREGGGFEETEGIARRISMLLNDADMWGRQIMTSAWMAERVQPAMQLINEIAPYYGSGPLYDPETMQRLDRAPNPERPPAAE